MTSTVWMSRVVRRGRSLLTKISTRIERTISERALGFFFSMLFFFGTIYDGGAQGDEIPDYASGIG